MDQYEQEKKNAAGAAVEYVQDGMLLGVGSGTTVKYFIDFLAEKVKAGIQVQVVPTSDQTRKLCEEHGIPMYQGECVPEQIDLTVDGADQFDSQLNLIKGGGGCLLWEKIVASASLCEIIIADSRKRTACLGDGFSLPIEVIPYALTHVRSMLKKMGISAELRVMESKKPFITDEGNYILDCSTGALKDAVGLAASLSQITGVVEHGLFIGLTDMVIEAKGEEVNTYFAKSPIITSERQKKTFAAIDAKIQQCRDKGEIPVIEMDLDLTTFVTMERTILALQHAGETYDIPEFKNPTFALLPGYTREAWVNFISRYRLVEKYPALRWMGEKDGKDGDSVYSAFHSFFWKTELLALDTLTAGLPEFIRRMQEKGAVTVFVSGRWKEEQTEPTRAVLKKGGLEDIPLFIGNPRHDGQNPISDSQIKALHQPEIREKYGVPAVFIDDRKDNRQAVCDANPGIKMLSVGCSIPGFTFDEETTGVEYAISDFMDNHQ